MSQSSNDGAPTGQSPTGQSPTGQSPTGHSTIDFSTFVLSLASSAMLHLGKVPDPMGGPARLNLPLARQSIDMLALLKEKTRGNLTSEEDILLSRLLHDIRMAWVEGSRDGAS